MRYVLWRRMIASSRSILFALAPALLLAAGCKLQVNRDIAESVVAGGSGNSGGGTSGGGTSGGGSSGGGGSGTAPIASVSGQPSGTHQITSLSIMVGGTTVVTYKYKLGIGADCAVSTGYSGEIPVTNPITDTLSTDGAYKLCVVGASATAVWQAESSATEAAWTLDRTAGAFTHNVNFNSASGFSFDSALIEFVSGVARLIGFDGLSDSTAADFNQATLTNMTVNSAPDRVDVNSTNIWTYPDNGANTWLNMAGNLMLFHFDETGATTLNDSSGNNNSLSCTTCPTQGQTGRFGTAINPATGGATRNHDATLNAYPISFAFWIKYSVGNNKPIIEKRDGGGAGYRVFVESSRICLDYILDGSNFVNWFCPGAINNINDGKWHFVVAVIDAAGGRIYQDSTLVASGGWTGTPGPVTTNANFVLGNNWYWNNFDGVLDELAVFNRALNSNEILEIYQRQKLLYSGSFVSRIFDDGVPFNWDVFSWETSFPAGKPLPDGDAGGPNSETVFTTGNVDMTDNAFLYHAEGTGPVANASTRTDSSGLGHIITANNADATGLSFVSDGQFGSALSFADGDDALNAGAGASIADLSTATWSMWVKWDGDRGNLLRKDDGNGDEGWFIEFRGFDGCLGLTVVYGSTNLRRHTNTLPPRGVWFHLGVTWDGTSDKTGARVFINGEEISYNCVNDNGVGTRASDASRPLMFGEGLNTKMDEIAIWRRILSDVEIKNLYLRGANQVKFQVQSCSNATCTPESFVGPDGTANSYFNAGSYTGQGQPTVSLGSSATSTQYFRYKAIVDSMDLATAPSITRVEPKPVTYNASSPSITSGSLIDFSTLSTFANTISAGTSCATYQVSTDGSTWYYYNAGSWQAATLPAHSNAASVVNTNLAAFAIQQGAGYFYLKTFLNSSGLTPCELDNVQFQGTR